MRYHRWLSKLNDMLLHDYNAYLFLLPMIGISFECCSNSRLDFLIHAIRESLIAAEEEEAVEHEEEHEGVYTVSSSLSSLTSVVASRSNNKMVGESCCFTCSRASVGFECIKTRIRVDVYMCVSRQEQRGEIHVWMRIVVKCVSNLFRKRIAATAYTMADDHCIRRERQCQGYMA